MRVERISAALPLLRDDLPHQSRLLLFLDDCMAIACSCLSEGHADSVLRSKDHHRARFNRLAGGQLKVIFPEQIAQNHEDLQHRVVAADASPRSAPKGEMGEGRVLRLVRFGEARWVETLRVLPVARRMVCAVNVHNNRRSPGYRHVPRKVVCNGLAVNHPKRRVKSKRFLNDLGCELESGNVAESKRRIPQHSIELLTYFLEAFRVRTQKIEKPRQTI